MKTVRFNFGAIAVLIPTLLGLLISVSAKAETRFLTLCYHNVGSKVEGDPYATRTSDLIAQFDFLKTHYNVISLEDVLAARSGKMPLPEKAVLLTFDDGLASFHDIVYPLLKAYRFKAVFSVVGHWVDQGVFRNYGIPQGDPKTVSWKQLRMMSQSGWVQVASHSYDLHHGSIFNPQGNEAPTASFFTYDPKTQTYEIESHFFTRVHDDLLKSQNQIRKKVGANVPLMTWPYGSYNQISKRAAEKAGMSIQLSLQSGLNDVRDLSMMRRGLIKLDVGLGKFADLLRQAFVPQVPVRALSLDLDDVWDADPAVMAGHLDRLLDRLQPMGLNTVYLRAVSRGTVPFAYFPNQSLAVRADFLNRVAHSIMARTSIENVMAVLPAKLGEDADLIRNLAKFNHLTGLILEVPGSDAVSVRQFESAKAAAGQMRPFWGFGVMLSSFDSADVDIWNAKADQVLISRASLPLADVRAWATHARSLPEWQKTEGRAVVTVLTSASGIEATALQNKLQLLGYTHFSYALPSFITNAAFDTAIRDAFLMKPQLTSARTEDLK